MLLHRYFSDNRTSVAVKHYLRGEDGIEYNDLWPLVKFLPPYALPTAISTAGDAASPIDDLISPSNSPCNAVGPSLDLPMHYIGRPRGTGSRPINGRTGSSTSKASESLRTSPKSHSDPSQVKLKSSRLSPGISIWNFWPFSFFGGFDKEGKIRKHKTVKEKAKLGTHQHPKANSHNVPLEIIFYLVCYYRQHR